jgi:colanic acid/amylovoran biosynthesis glycosyltransferase
MPVRRQRRSDRLHLLELDVRWPPETFLGWKFEALVARGMRVTVASRSIFDPDARLDGVDLVALPQRPAPRHETAVAVRELVGNLRPDIVHLEWNRSAVRYMPMFTEWGCPVVVSAHGYQISAEPHLPGNDGFASQLPALMRSASVVHCVSESLQRRVLALGADPGKVRIIRQGVDPAVFHPGNRTVGLAGGELRVITVGWPRWVKGFAWAIQAVRLAVDAGVPVQLEIVGSSAGEASEQARLRHAVDDLALGDRVRLAPAASSAEVARRLRASDVLLLPSLDEGLPTVVLEAMASGVPVVATDCGGVSEAVRDGVEGFLVAPRDAAGLATALARLWGEPELRARMGETGRRTVTSRFTLERQIGQFLALYEQLAEAPLPNVGPSPSATGPSAPEWIPGPHSLRAVSAGPLIWEHGLEHSVHAIGLLRDAGIDCRYVIIGDGGHLPAIAFARHQLGLTDRIEIVSADDGKRVVHELSLADVFVDPAVSDMPGTAPGMAALAAGVPLVATWHPGAQHRDGILVPRRDPYAIAEALAGLASDRAMARSPEELTA